MASAQPIGVLFQFWPRADGTGRMEFISKGAESFLESSAEEIGWMLERRCLPLFGVDEEKFYSSVEHAIWQKVPWSSELGYLTPKTQRRLWLHFQSYPRTAPDGQAFFTGHWLDLTPMKNAEEASRRAYSVLTTHLENTPLAVIEWDSEFRIERWSGQAEAIFGWSAEEVRGKWAHEWPFVHPEDAGRVAEVIRKLHTQAEPRNVCINKNLHKSGRLLHCIWHNSVVVDAGGCLVSILSLVEDQSAKMELDRQLMEAHRLENVGFLAGGIAHAFNNLITIIMGHAGIVREQASTGANAGASLDEIDAACLRAARLCEQITAVAGIGSTIGTGLELNLLLRAVRTRADSLVDEGVILDFQYSPVHLTIRGDSRQLQQVIESLVLNGAESLGSEGGRVEVACALRTISNANDAGGFFPNPLPGDYAVLRVADTGGGIAEEIRGKVFQPFFTTKSVGRGLGLAAVRGIMHAHAGYVRVQSGVGAGTSIELLFPLLPD